MTEVNANSETSATTPQLVVVGGGFCGTALAIHLMRLASRPVDLTILDPRPDIGRGVAYSSSDPVHRINISAARMSVFEDDRGHFDRWAADHGAHESDPGGVQLSGSFYARRSLFGDYVAALFDEAHRANPAVRVRHVAAAAIAIDGGAVKTDRGDTLPADVMVIATGNPQPELPGPLRPLAGHPAMIDNVWQAGSLDIIRPADRILIVGTGLTMGDVVASLRARGHAGPITALSRHGLTPLKRKPRPYPVWGDFSTAPSRTALDLLRRIRRGVADAMREEFAWESVIDAVRQQGQAVWAALPHDEKKRYLRHLRPYWEIHRYQVAPPVDNALRAAIADGQVTIVAGSLIDAAARADAFDIGWRRRGRSRASVEHGRFDVVINCTGPAIDAVIRTNPFLSSLARESRIRADPLGLGLAVDADSRTVGRQGDGFPTLYALGLLSRGRFGEISGIRELSAQAAAVALAIVRRYGLADCLPRRGDLLDLHNVHPQNPS